MNTALIIAAIEASTVIMNAVARYSRGDISEAELLKQMDAVNDRAKAARELWERSG